jgi:hypothetical protein
MKMKGIKIYSIIRIVLTPQIFSKDNNMELFQLIFNDAFISKS